MGIILKTDDIFIVVEMKQKILLGIIPGGLFKQLMTAGKSLIWLRIILWKYRKMPMITTNTEKPQGQSFGIFRVISYLWKEHLNIEGRSFQISEYLLQLRALPRKYQGPYLS
jgi:hypothetical protein